MKTLEKKKKIQLTEIEENVIALAYNVSYMCQGILKGHDHREIHQDSYGFIASDKQYITTVLLFLKKQYGENKDIKILDLGCGVSPLIITLQLLGYKNLIGVDFNPTNLVFLDSLMVNLGYKRPKLIHKDIASLTKTDLKGIDFVYSYMPIANAEKYEEIIGGIWDNYPVNTIHMELFGPIQQAIGSKNTSKELEFYGSSVPTKGRIFQKI